MSNNELYSPQKMIDAQAEIQSKMERGEYSEAEDLGDFGTYYALKYNLPIADKWIQSHGLSGEPAEIYALYFRKYCIRARSILDIGCGAGFITNSLKSVFPKAEVWGVDLASDGIEFAKQNFEDCSFFQAIVDDMFDLNRQFDVIHVREFYPFTRIDDWGTMRGVLVSLVKHLADNGVLLIINNTAPDMMNNNLFRYISKIKMDKEFSDLTISVHRIPRIKAMSLLGTGLSARILSWVVDLYYDNSVSLLRLQKKGTQP